MGFNAPVSKFSSPVSNSSFPEAITTFMFMASAAIDDNHLASILAVVAYDIGAEAEVKPSSCYSSADLVHTVRYETVASISRQCEKRDNKKPSSSPLSVNQGKLDHGRRPV